MDGATIPILTASVISIIGAIGGAVVLIINAIRTTQKSQDGKLKDIHVLVNSRYSAVLEELARVKALLANRTGNTSDKRDAIIAQQAADDQAKRVEKKGQP